MDPGFVGDRTERFSVGIESEEWTYRVKYGDEPNRSGLWALTNRSDESGSTRGRHNFPEWKRTSTTMAEMASQNPCVRRRG